MPIGAGVKTLFIMDRASPGRTVAARVSIIGILVIVVMLLFWIFRNDLEDSNDGHISAIDVIYFTFVTLTTVGYGDIVPVTENARFLDVIIVTPVRVIIWFILIGTTYELIIPRYLELWRLDRMKKTLEGHTIIAGYGSVGKAVAVELLHNGLKKENIVIIDEQEEHVEQAASDGFVALHGDITSENILNKAVIVRAKDIIVASRKDDTNVLTSLTARDLNPSIKIIARVNFGENIKNLRRGGADVVICPSVAGGKLMAVATKRGIAAKVIEDLLTAEEGLGISQREVRLTELDKRPSELKGCVVIAIQRGKKVLTLPELEDMKLKKGDILVSIEPMEVRSE